MHEKKGYKISFQLVLSMFLCAEELAYYKVMMTYLSSFSPTFSTYTFLKVGHFVSRDFY